MNQDSIGYIFIGIILGLLMGVFLTLQFDDRIFVDFESAKVLDTELNNYCNSDSENVHIHGVYRWYYNGQGMFEAFQCRYDSPIEPITKLQGLEK